MNTAGIEKEQGDTYKLVKEKGRTVTHLSTYGLALFLLLTPFEYPLASMVSVSPLRLVGLLAMALAAVDILIQGAIKINDRLICMLLFLMYGAMTVLWVTNTSRFFSFYSVYFNNAIMFILFAAISFTKEEVALLKKSMVAGVGALLLYMTFVPSAVTYSVYQHRLTLNAGTDDLDQNYLAALMLVAFGLVFYAFCNKKQNVFIRVLSIAFCGGIVYYALLTGSRSGLLSIALIVFLSINTSWKNRLMLGVPLLLLFFVVYPMVIEWLPEELAERFSIAALTGQKAESHARLAIWEKAFASLRGFRWVFGYGVGAAQTVVGDVLGNGRDMAIHNHYLAMITEVGVLGFIFINYPIFHMVKVTWRREKVISVSFIGILTMALFLDVVTTKFFWAAMILLAACCSEAANETDIQCVGGQGLGL